MNESLVQWLEEGNITFSSTLLLNYKQMNLNEEELVLLLHVLDFQNKGNTFPTPTELSSRMTISVSGCSDLLRRLVQKGFIAIDVGHSAQEIGFEKYTLKPLWEKLVECYLTNKRAEEKMAHRKEEVDLYTCFEQEFGRPLSPFECESLSMWVDEDNHEPIIIKAALREAVISGKLNFRYIDRILFEWKRNGIKTIEQAKSYGRKFRKGQAQQASVKSDEKINTNAVPFYNWLEQ